MWKPEEGKSDTIPVNYRETAMRLHKRNTSEGLAATPIVTAECPFVMRIFTEAVVVHYANANLHIYHLQENAGTCRSYRKDSGYRGET